LARPPSRGWRANRRLEASIVEMEPVNAGVRTRSSSVLDA
jgi:hypothetical protein